MKSKAIVADPLGYETQALVLGMYEDEGDDSLLTRFDAALHGVVRRLRERKEFTGRISTAHLLKTLGCLPAEQLILVGMGKRKEMTPERLRQAAGTASLALKSAGVTSCATILHQQFGGDPSHIQAVVEGANLGAYSFDSYRSSPPETAKLTELVLLVGSRSGLKAADQAAATASAICDGVRLARDLVSHPGNVATPAYMADRALSVASRGNIRCHVMDTEDIERLGMNGLLFVGKGSAHPPRFIVMEYSGAEEKVRPVVIVGKGITFDSGGISLKPREGMERMKDDMAGAAAVIGVLQTVAALRLRVNLVGLVPAAENMPDGRAYKPGDVVTTMSGKTVEINNTDAEGRMVLCDALHYGLRYKPRAMIDLATLTGACMVALGTAATGMMGNDGRLKKALEEAGKRTGERVWELPLWEEYGDAMKSDIADLKNSGGQYGGAITAGWFLQQFVGNAKWVHLDIAGTAWEEKGRHYLPKGATGVGVRLITEYLRMA